MSEKKVPKKEKSFSESIVTESITERGALKKQSSLYIDGSSVDRGSHKKGKRVRSLYSHREHHREGESSKKRRVSSLPSHKVLYCPKKKALKKYSI